MKNDLKVVVGICPPVYCYAEAQNGQKDLNINSYLNGNNVARIVVGTVKLWMQL